MKLKKWLKYLIYLTLLIGLLTLNLYVIREYKLETSTTYQFYSYRLYIISLVNMAIGAVLGAEQLFSEKRKSGRWRVNAPKLLLLGIPALYFSLYIVLAYTKAGIIYYPIFKFGSLINSTDFLLIFQLVFGYVLTTGFYKDTAAANNV